MVWLLIGIAVMLWVGASNPQALKAGSTTFVVPTEEQAETPIVPAV